MTTPPLAKRKAYTARRHVGRVDEAKPRILHIDDSPSDAFLLGRRLSAEGFAIEHVETGRAALTAVIAHPHDLVLLDYSLPDQTGLELLASILDRRPDAGVIILSGHVSSAIMARALLLGALDVLDKNDPRLIAHLHAQLARQTRQHRANAASRAAVSAYAAAANQRLRDRVVEILATLHANTPGAAAAALIDAAGTTIATAGTLPPDGATAATGWAWRTWSNWGARWGLGESTGVSLEQAGGRLVVREAAPWGILVLAVEPPGTGAEPEHLSQALNDLAAAAAMQA